MLSRIGEYKTERALEAETLPSVKELNAGINLAFFGFNSIIERVSYIGLVWESMRNDVQTIYKIIDSENTSEAKEVCFTISSSEACAKKRRV